MTNAVSFGNIATRWNSEHPGDLKSGRRGSRRSRRGQDQQESAPPEADYELVKKAVARMADRLGVDRTGWEKEFPRDS
jgi:hypothetical protein